METLKINETPVRTSRNFQINNIKLDDLEIPSKVNGFDNVEIRNESSKINVEEICTDINLTYGLGNVLTSNVNNNSNKDLKITVDSKTNKELEIDFGFNKKNLNLIDNIEIEANKGSKGTVILKYKSEDETVNFHNGIIKLKAKKDSKVNVIVVNLLNSNSNNFIAIQNEFHENAKANYTIIDFGGKTSVSNYYSDLKGKEATDQINTIYLGNKTQVFDLNYIAELRGEKTNINIEVQGALNDTARKHFKGTIDFKKGCKKATGNENESCMLLSDKAKSLALPMLLCSEEDVEGNHSSSAGKVGDKELFYIMSRGFDQKEAMKLMVRAKFNNILENIKNEKLKNEIIEEINKKLD